MSSTSLYEVFNVLAATYLGPLLYDRRRVLATDPRPCDDFALPYVVLTQQRNQRQQPLVVIARTA